MRKMLSGQDFRMMRQTLGYSQTDLACALNVTPVSIWHWETGKRAVPAHVCDWICDRISAMENVREKFAELPGMLFLPVPENLSCAFIMDIDAESVSDIELRCAAIFEAMKRKTGIVFFGLTDYSAWLACERRDDSEASRKEFWRLCAIGGKQWLRSLR